MGTSAQAAEPQATEATAEPVANTIPVLAVADLQVAIAFYTQKLGFGLKRGGDADSRICSVGRDKRTIMLRQEPAPRPNRTRFHAKIARFHQESACYPDIQTPIPTR